MLLLRFIRGGLTMLSGSRGRDRAQLSCRAPAAAAKIRHDDCDYNRHAARGTLLATVAQRQRIPASFLLRGDSAVNIGGTGKPRASFMADNSRI